MSGMGMIGIVGALQGADKNRTSSRTYSPYLTTRLLREHAAAAEALPHEEPAGWFWSAYATALQ